MLPIQTDYTNRVYTLPSGTEENDLPCEMAEDPTGAPVQITTWEPTAEELAALVGGGKIRLAIWGAGHPPVAIRVQKVDADGKLIDELVES